MNRSHLVAGGLLATLCLLIPAAAGIPQSTGATALTAAGSDGPSTRRLDKQVVVDGTLEDIWRCWTTSEGIASFFTPQSRIDLRPGGPYELYMGMNAPDASGLRGSQGCCVLSLIPMEMLAFEWNFPPAIMTLRKAGAKTQVVLRFDDQGGCVRVRFSQIGWKQGEDWDAGYAYFDRAWDWVLTSL